MIHLLLTIGPEWFWHPLGQCTAVSTNHAIATHEVMRCKSYNWYSGFAANFGELTIITGILVGTWRFKKKTECHVEAPKNCHRFGRPVAGTGHRACRLHHPHAEEKGGGTTAEDIQKHHEDSELGQAQGAYVGGQITVEALEGAIESALRHEREREDKQLDETP